MLKKESNLFVIRPNTSGTVRTTLCIDDVRFFSSIDILESFGLISKELYKTEHFYWFKVPYRIPKFNKFYASRIKSISDPYLPELIRRLIYLNPTPDFLMLKKITEFIVMRFSVMEMKDSKVKAGEMIATPVLSFEEVHGAVVIGANRRSTEDYEPDNEKIIMFPRDSEITKEGKIAFSNEYRGYAIRHHMEAAIHTVAEMMIDSNEHVKLTGARLEDSSLIRTKKDEPAPLRSIRKFMSGRTKKVISEHNEFASFKTLSAQQKYMEYLELPYMTMDNLANELEVSKRTVSEFKKLRTFIENL